MDLTGTWPAASKNPQAMSRPGIGPDPSGSHTVHEATGVSTPGIPSPSRYFQSGGHWANAEHDAVMPTQRLASAIRNEKHPTPMTPPLSLKRVDATTGRRPLRCG